MRRAVGVYRGGKDEGGGIYLFSTNGEARRVKRRAMRSGAQPDIRSGSEGQTRQKKVPKTLVFGTLAQRVGFEPTVPLPVHLISSQGRYNHFDTAAY